MKRVLFGVVIVLVALALLAVPASTVRADNGDCVSGPIGTTFSFTFYGFTPNHWVNIYLVEPDGTATPPFGPSTVKSDGAGTVHYSHGTDFGDATIAYGTWQIVATEPGLAGSIAHQDQSCFTVTGGTGASVGAWLSANPSTVTKPQQGYGHIPIREPGVNAEFDVYNFATTSITGGGFAPGEVVSFWAEQPNGECSSLTSHDHFRITNGGIVDVKENTPFYNGLSTFALGNATATAGGTVSFNVPFFVYDCEGTWRIVGRGNASGIGGETWVTVEGNSVAVNANLVASKTSVAPLFDTVAFYGWGYAANEHVSCWLTSPQGQALGVPDNTGFFGDFGTFKIRGVPIMASSGGTIGFELVTGSYYAEVTVSGGGAPTVGAVIKEPVQSEGAQGMWAMTCRGDASGNAGIAWFDIGGSGLPGAGGAATGGTGTVPQAASPAENQVLPESGNANGSPMKLPVMGIAP